MPGPRTSIVCALILFAGCAEAPRRQTQYVTEHDARLICSARHVLGKGGDGPPYDDAIYQVRPRNDGWLVEVDQAHGYKGAGDPLSTTVDFTIFVRFDAQENPTDILSNAGRWPIVRAPSTRQ